MVSPVITESIIKLGTYLEKDVPMFCSVSGGSDSDIVVDLICKYGFGKDVDFVFFDTGLEYKATKEHLDDLEEKYGISIRRLKAIKSIPYCCKEYGVPFISKHVSNMLSRLQKHNFQFEDEDFDTLYKKYPNCKSALRWWCNCGATPRLNISWNKYLKEFLIANPPKFKISDVCCKYAKKRVSEKYIKDNGILISITGVRKAEGGVRSTTYKSCYESDTRGFDNFRPIFWYKDSDKKEYENLNDIHHSRCYTEYGLKRTGCCGCPFGRDFEDELNIIKTYEPNLYKVVMSVFGESYEYTRQYREFVRDMKMKKDRISTLDSFFDLEQ